MNHWLPFEKTLLPLLACIASAGAADAQSGTLRFSTNAFTLPEGGASTITVERVGGSVGRVQVDYAAYGGPFDTATTHYGGSFLDTPVVSWAAAAGTLVWNDGDSTPKAFTVTTLQDSLVEGNETLSLRLAEPEGAAQLGLAAAKLTILDNDTPAAGALHFSTPLYFVSEGGVNALITVRRTAGSAGAVGVSYATASAGLSNAAGIVATNPATPGTDYTDVIGTLTWAAGDTADNTFLVPIVKDTTVDSLGNEPAAFDHASRFAATLGLRFPVFQAPIGSVARRELAAAVSQAGGLGACFVATHESRAHDLYKRRLVEAGARDTALTVCFDGGWPHAAHRVLRNSTLDEWEAAGCPPPGRRPGEGDRTATKPGGRDFLRYEDTLPRATMVGNPQAMCLYAGTSCEDIRDVPPVRELMERLWNECETSALNVCTAEPGRSAEKTLRP